MKKRNKEDSEFIPVIVLSYIMPFFLNGTVSLFLKNQITVKGAMLTGFSQYVFASMVLLFNMYLIYNVFFAFIKFNDPYLEKFLLVKKFLSSFFFVFWLITLIYQNFIPNEYYRFYANIILYIPLYYSQYEFVKKMKNYSKQFEKKQSRRNAK